MGKVIRGDQLTLKRCIHFHHFFYGHAPNGASVRNKDGSLQWCISIVTLRTRWLQRQAQQDHCQCRSHHAYKSETGSYRNQVSLAKLRLAMVKWSFLLYESIAWYAFESMQRPRYSISWHGFSRLLSKLILNPRFKRWDVSLSVFCSARSRKLAHTR